MAGKLNVQGAALGLDAALGRATVSSRTVYLALLTAAPAQGAVLSGLAEYSATGYSRQVISFVAPAGTPRLTSNSATVTYGPLTGANGVAVVTHWAVVSAASGTSGEVVAYGDFAVSRTPAAGDSMSVAAGAITVSID